MSMHLKIAARNIVRHRRGSLLVVVSVALSVVAMEFVAGFAQGIREIFENILDNSGHLQAHAALFRDSLDPLALDALLPEGEAVVAAARSLTGVRSAERVLSFGAYLIHDEEQLAMQGIGLEANTAFYGRARNNMQEGSFDLAGNSVVLSVAMAKLLGTQCGGFVNVLVEDRDAIPQYLECAVAGLFETGASDTDDNCFFIAHETAAELLFVPGFTREVRILLEDRDAAPVVKENLATALGGKPVLLETWTELSGSWVALVELMDVFMLVVDLILFVVVATLIVNSMVMNIFKRMREYGTLRAIGCKRFALFFQISLEGILLGALGGVAGLLISLPVIAYFTTYGINFGEMVEAFGLGRGSVLYFASSGSATVLSVSLGTLIAVSAALYAGRIAARLKLTRSLFFS